MTDDINQDVDSTKMDDINSNVNNIQLDLINSGDNKNIIKIDDIMKEVDIDRQQG